MKTKGKYILPAAAVMVAVLLTACRREELLAPADGIITTDRISTQVDQVPPMVQKGDLVPLLNGSWKLASLNGNAITIQGGLAPTIKIQGSLEGFGGCNRIFGTVVQSQDRLSFPSVGSTSMRCLIGYELELQFIAALRNTERFSLDPIGTLRLFKGDAELASLDKLGRSRVGASPIKEEWVSDDPGPSPAGD